MPARAGSRPVLTVLKQSADRPPHATKDPPDEQRPRTTWFLAAANQRALRDGLGTIAAALHMASLTRGGPPLLPHPEAARFFHLSMRNNRGGDPRRSIGDIHARDLPFCRPLRSIKNKHI